MNVTVIKQLAPEARVLPQLFVSAKLLGSAPVIEIPERLTEPSPLFATAIFLGRLFVPTGCVPKFTLAGVNFKYVLVPVSLTFCGLPGALSVTEI